MPLYYIVTKKEKIVKISKNLLYFSSTEIKAASNMISLGDIADVISKGASIFNIGIYIGVALLPG